MLDPVNPILQSTGEPPTQPTVIELKGVEIPAEEPQDEPWRWRTAVACAVHFGLAPVLNEANESLSQLLVAAGEEPPKNFTVIQWVEGLINLNLAELRARALWPHKEGTKVSARTEAAGGKEAWFTTTTTSEARPLPNGDVLVSVEGMTGAVRAQDLRLASE